MRENFLRREKRDQLYMVKCCKMQAGSVKSGCHICRQDVHDEKRVLKWKFEMISVPKNMPSKKEKDTKNLVYLPIKILTKLAESFHNKPTNAKCPIHTVSKVIKPLTCINSAQVVDKKSSHTLIITKHIRENSTLDIQISSTHSKSYSVDPTVSLVHISKTFSCCLLHVKYPIECYAPEILNAPPFHPCNMLSDYVMSWQPIVEAESITNSTSSKRVPVIMKELRLEDFNIEMRHSLISHPNTK